MKNPPTYGIKTYSTHMAAKIAASEYFSDNVIRNATLLPSFLRAVSSALENSFRVDSGPALDATPEVVDATLKSLMNDIEEKGFDGKAPTGK